MGIVEMFKRWRTRMILREYVSPEIAEEILRTAAKLRQFEKKHFQFVAVLADETNPKDIPAIVGRVVDTLLKHDAYVSDITPPLVFALLGEPFPEGNSPEARRELVGALLRESNERIRVAHGECDGDVGPFGSQQRYGAVIPGLSGILKALLETKPGAAVEVR